MRVHTANAAMVAGAAFGLLCVMTLRACTAGAQPAPPTPDLVRDGQDMRPETVLARVCAKEAGFTGLTDCAPISRVLLRVGRGDVVRGARWYSPRTFDPTRLRQKPWLAYLRADGAEPRHWPSHLSWRAHQPRWLELVDLARDLLDGAAEPPCEIDHWGAPYGVDLERALSRGWERVDCGPTRNAFWRIPRRRS